MNSEPDRPSPTGIGALLRGLRWRQLALLWGILTIAALLRLLGLGWGLPPPSQELAEAGLHGSYALDEEELIRAASRPQPDRYLWGTLHFPLVSVSLDLAQRAGVFTVPWRQAFETMRPGDFERVYILARMVTATVDLLAVLLVFVLAAEFVGVNLALWAAALIAFSPGHVLQATQARVDPTATALGVALMLAALRVSRRPSGGAMASVGLLAGLAMAAKYSMLLIVAAMLGWLWWRAGRGVGNAARLAAGAAAGFLIGEPYLLTDTADVLRDVWQLIRLNGPVDEQWRIAPHVLLAWHLEYLARFSLGIPAFFLAAFGLWEMRRRKNPAHLLLALVCAAGVLSWFPQKWPLLRYQLPLLPFLAIAAAIGLKRLRGRSFWGALALIVALAASCSQTNFQLQRHPVNLALAVARKAIPEGDVVSRIMAEIPPLPESLYPMGPNPLMEDLSRQPPPWVITSDLPLADYPAANLRLLAEQYQPVAVFRARRILPWATLGEARAPHDWKYTHPSVTIYRRK